MTIRKIEAGRVITQDIDSFIGYKGTIWYDEETGEMRLFDGNPGGIPLGSGGGGYVLHTATITRLGGVRIGVGIDVSPNGTISVNTGTPYVLTIATTSTLGGVIIGAGIDVSPSGVISVNTGTPYVLTTATTDTVGGVKIGAGINVSADGTISVNSSTYFTLTAGTDTAVSTSTGNVTVWVTSTLQSVTDRGSTTSNAINITSIAATTSTTTGALIVAGGVGIGGNLFVGGDITGPDGSLVLIATTSTAPNRQNGQLWFNSDDGRAYIKYDGTWVDLSPTIVPPVSTYLGDLTIDGTTISTIDSTLTNIYIDSILDVTGAIYTNNYLVSTLTNISSGIGISVSRTNSGTVTVNNTGVLEIAAGVDTSISTATGVVTINNTSTLQSVTNRGSTTTNAISIGNIANTTSTTTGALTVAGGVGIGGDLFIDGDVRNINGSLVFVATTSTAPTRQNGQIWFNSEDGRAYIKYDGTWVDLSPSIVPPPSTYLGDLTIDSTTIGTISSTLTNIYIDSILDVSGKIYTGNYEVSTITNIISGSGISVSRTSSGTVIITNTGGVATTGTLEVVAGVDIAISTSTPGVVVINNISTLQSVTNRGSTTTKAIKITNKTNSTSTNTGALIVDGGIGVGGNIWAGGVLYAKNLGSPSNRIGKLYVEGQTIDIGGTLISIDVDGGLLIQKSNSDLEKLSAKSVTLGSTGTGSVSLLVVDGNLIINSNSIIVRGLITTGTVTATNVVVNGLIESTSTVTGSLVISGGVGIGGNTNIGGNLVAGPIYDSGNRVLTSVVPTGGDYIGVVNVISSGTQTSFTVINLGVQTITAGTDTAVSSSTGTVTIWATSTLQSITDRGATTTNAISITSTATSTSSSAGALTVAGGVGIGENLYVGGLINIGQTSTILGAEIITTATIGNYASASTGPTASSTGTTSSFLISDLTVSTSTNTGALVVNGGVGIGGALYVGTTSFINGSEIITTATISLYASNASQTTSTLQTVTDIGNSTTNAIVINNFDISTSTNTGALIVGGGVGIGGDLYIGNALYANTTSFAAGAEILTTGTIDLYAVTLNGVQTLTNKTIIVPNGGAIYFDSDIALSQVHGALLPYKQTSAAPKMYTNRDFNTGILWMDAGEFNPDDGWNVIDSVADNTALPVGYVGNVYDAYITLNDNHVWYWAALSITDLKPGDIYYDDIGLTVNLCFLEYDANGNAIYSMLDITPK